MEPNGTGYRIARALFPQESDFLALMDLDPPDPPPGSIKKKIRVKVSSRKKSRAQKKKSKNGNMVPKIRSYDSSSDSEERISKRRGIKVSEDKVPMDNVIIDLSSKVHETNLEEKENEYVFFFKKFLLFNILANY